MSKEMVLGIVRHVLTFGGGLLVTKGLIDETIVTELVGGLITLVGGVWSVFDKKR